MDTVPLNKSKSLSAIVSYLFARREAILHNWRMACEQDPMLAKVSVLSREEFNNLLPVILDILEQRLLNQPPKADLGITAMSHGLHRWQKALALAETIRELNYLTETLFSELHTYLELFPQLDARVLLQVQKQVVEIMGETTHGSVKKYDELQRLEAANRVATLQQALDQMGELSRQRGDMLRTSSHDLRGSLGIINSAACLLKTEGLSDQDREQYLDMLNRNLTNVQAMLDSLMELARLEAGEEILRLEHLDATLLLNEIVASAQAIANQRGLILQATGPDTLPIETDKVKLQRIVQNLLLNALAYTPTGFISVSWSQQSDMRWVVSIQDSGPGLPHTLTNVLARQHRNQKIPSGPALAEQVGRADHGEGVGLQIVKRLCDLLDASLEIESQAGRGTLFRIRFPMHWEG